MPEKKRQHYIPKSYMRAFANERKMFAIFNLKDRSAHFPVSYESQCYADYFYGGDVEIENRLGVLENTWKKALDVARNRLPLSLNNIQKIKEFAIFQRQRTLAESEYGKQEKIELYIEYGKSIYAHKGMPFNAAAQDACVQFSSSHAVPPAEILKNVDMIVPLIQDLELLIINYETQSRLISSDVPIILINPFCPQQIGFGCMGLIILFPISSHQLVVLYDAKMYPRYKSKMYMSLSNEKEVYNLNTLQLVSAEKILFGYNADEFSRFKSQAFQDRARNRTADKANKLGPEGHKLMMTSLRKTVCSFSFSFGKIRSDFAAVPAIYREAVPRIWEQEWEDKLRVSGDIVRQLSKIPNSPLKSSGVSGKEYYRERNKLLRCALRYWSE